MSKLDGGDSGKDELLGSGVPKAGSIPGTEASLPVADGANDVAKEGGGPILTPNRPGPLELYKPDGHDVDLTHVMVQNLYLKNLGPLVPAPAGSTTPPPEPNVDVHPENIPTDSYWTPETPGVQDPERDRVRTLHQHLAKGSTVSPLGDIRLNLTGKLDLTLAPPDVFEGAKTVPLFPPKPDNGGDNSDDLVILSGEAE